MNCRKCGAPIDADDVFCPECGAKLHAAECAYCGGPIEPADEFCPGCGKAVETRKPPPKPEAKPAPPEPEPPPKPEPPKPAETQDKKPSYEQLPPPIRYAGFWMRFFALVLDLIFVPLIFSPLIIGTTVVGYFFGVMNPHIIDNHYLYQFAAAAGGIAYSLVFFFYFLIGHSFGSTIGKKIMGIRLATYNGSRPGFWRALVRETLGRFLASLIFYLGYLWIAWDSHKQGWHDKIAGTFCIRTR